MSPISCRGSTGWRWSRWCFRRFRDGRAYSQARLLRERFGYRGELRATGQVLRDQFVFMLRAGFDAFEVKKHGRRGGVRRDRAALFGVLSADRRWPPHRAAPAHAVAPFRRVPANERPAPSTCCEPARRDAAGAPLDHVLRDASPARDHRDGAAHRRPRAAGAGVVVRHRIGGAAQGDGRGRSRHPVVFLDTGWLFEETLAYRDTLIATLGLRDVRSIKPLDETLAREDPRARIVVLRSRCLLPDPQSRAAGARAGSRSRPGSTAASAFRAGCAPRSRWSRPTARG